MLRSRKEAINVAGQTSTVTSDVVNMTDRTHQRMLARLVSNANVAGTLDVVVQHNPNPTASTGWKTLVTFTQKTSETNDVEDVHVPFLTTHLFPHFRVVATIASSGNYDFNVNLWFD